jgi:hypothetical protein
VKCAVAEARIGKRSGRVLTVDTVEIELRISSRKVGVASIAFRSVLHVVEPASKPTPTSQLA